MRLRTLVLLGVLLAPPPALAHDARVAHSEHERGRDQWYEATARLGVHQPTKVWEAPEPAREYCRVFPHRDQEGFSFDCIEKLDPGSRTRDKTHEDQPFLLSIAVSCDNHPSLETALSVIVHMRRGRREFRLWCDD